jgi:catechol 2,3-dioxygenase-like lactoylglutathione lyase family enzyme
MIDLHHAHLFASDIDATIAWWTTMLDAEVAFDGSLAGARNVFLKVGRGRIHLYDQPPRHQSRGAVHHLGITTDDLPGLVARIRDREHSSDLTSGVRIRRYIMVARGCVA